MASKYTAETKPYKTAPNSDANATTEAQLNADAQDDVGRSGNAKNALKTGTRASYTPSGKPDEHSFGKDGGKPNIISGVPSVQVGGSFEVGTLPKIGGGKFSVGENKNVSTPVSGS